MRTGETPWSDATTNELRDMWAAGKSATLIATKLRISRNAVLGKVWRLHLIRREPIVTLDHISGWHKKKSGAQHRKERRARFLMKKPLPPQPPPPRIIEAPSNAPVHIADLEPHHCRWPIGEPSEMLFCGCSKQDPYSYCAFHVKQSRVQRN